MICNLGDLMSLRHPVVDYVDSRIEREISLVQDPVKHKREYERVLSERVVVSLVRYSSQHNQKQNKKILEST